MTQIPTDCFNQVSETFAMPCPSFELHEASITVNLIVLRGAQENYFLMPCFYECSHAEHILTQK